MESIIIVAYSFGIIITIGVVATAIYDWFIVEEDK